MLVTGVRTDRAMDAPAVTSRSAGTRARFSSKQQISLCPSRRHPEGLSINAQRVYTKSSVIPVNTESAADREHNVYHVSRHRRIGDCRAGLNPSLPSCEAPEGRCCRLLPVPESQRDVRSAARRTTSRRTAGLQQSQLWKELLFGFAFATCESAQRQESCQSGVTSNLRQHILSVGTTHIGNSTSPSFSLADTRSAAMNTLPPRTMQAVKPERRADGGWTCDDGV